MQKDQIITEEKAKIYSRLKMKLSIIDMIIDILLISFFAFSGISGRITSLIRSYDLGSDYAVFLVFLSVIGIAAGMVSFPLDFYSSYIIERRYNLSNQGLLRWTAERGKSLIVSLVLGIPVALVFYHFLVLTGNDWWLYFSGFVFFFAVLLARISPIIIYPIFYKFTPLQNGEVKDGIEKLLKDAGMTVRGLFTFNMSKNTKKANAGFTGIGKSRRIILSDTLIENFTPDEIRVIFAHELGHYKYRHIAKNILMSGIMIFFAFYICGSLYEWTRLNYGYISPTEIAAIPMLFFYLSVFSIIIMPLTNMISRKYEREADRFAIETTGDSASFISSMEKLAELNLSDREPDPVIEFLFYSHPSIKKRIEFAKSFELR
jgi:STE24 endopeptidase